LVCDQATGQCIRDCDVLHIDAFLTECSAEWDENNDTLTAMSASIADNAADIVTVTATADDNKNNIMSLASTTAANAADNADLDTKLTELETEVDSNAQYIAALLVTTNQTSLHSSNTRDLVEDIIHQMESDNTSYHNAQNIAANTQEIDDLKSRIEALELTITKLAVYAAESQSGNLDVGSSGNTMTGLVDNGVWSGYSFSTQDVVIIALLVFSVILVIGLITACAMGRGGRVGKVKYAPVMVAGDSEMEDLRR